MILFSFEFGANYAFKRHYMRILYLYTYYNNKYTYYNIHNYFNNKNYNIKNKNDF